jgi:hypothetical protein
MVMDVEKRSFISSLEGNVKPRGDGKYNIIQNYVCASYISTLRDDGNRTSIAFCAM